MLIKYVYYGETGANTLDKERAGEGESGEWSGVEWETAQKQYTGHQGTCETIGPDRGLTDTARIVASIRPSISIVGTCVASTVIPHVAHQARAFEAHVPTGWNAVSF